MRGNDEVNFEKISFLLQQLPSEVVWIFKAMHIIGVHNARGGGTTRNRLKEFTKDCIEGLSEKYSFMYKWYLKIYFWIRLFMFEKLFWLYKRIFGFLEVQFDEKNKMIEDI